MRVRDQGFALVLVLLAASGVFVLAMQGAVLLRSSTLEVRVLHEQALLERGARAAGAAVLTGLFEPDDASWDAVEDSLASRSPGAEPQGPDEDDLELPPIVKALLEAAGREIEDAAKEAIEEDNALAAAADGGAVASRSRSNRSLRLLEIAGLPVRPIEVRLREDGPLYRVFLSDATGQLNINEAGESQLRRYFEAAGVGDARAPRLAQQVLDWRDEDDFTHPYGAEQATYDYRGITCRNDRIRSLEELLYLPDMTPEIFDRIRPDLVLAGDGKVHAPSASPEVLMSLPGMSRDAVRAILRLRQAGRLTEESLAEAIPVMASDARDMLRLKPSNMVRVRVEAVGEARRTFEGLAIIDGNGIDSFGLKPL